jgi:alanine-glyoxylate transaminase/serine-glyoxylate transaminase/serine-pyruvate transaminase
MLTLDNHPRGRHFLQIPGPSPVPDRILRAMSLPTIDHRGPEFGALGRDVLANLGRVFQTRHPVVVYACSGTGAWEAALANTLSPGDRVLMVETGHFAALWQKLAARLGLDTEVLAWRGDGDPVLPQAPGWRQGVQADWVEERLRADRERTIRAVCVVHNETFDRCHLGHCCRAPGDRRGRSPGAPDGRLDLRPGERRPAARRLGHRRHHRRFAEGPHAAAGAGLQRRLAEGDRGLEDGEAAQVLLRLGRDPGDEPGRLLAIDAEHEPALRPARVARDAAAEGLPQVFARHRRWGRGVRAAVTAWGLPIQCADEALHSPVLTGVITPPGVDADALRRLIHDRFDLSLGTGLGKVKGRMFRMGHLGDSNDLTLVAMVAGVEAGLRLAGVPFRPGGVDAALRHFADHPLEATIDPHQEAST